MALYEEPEECKALLNFMADVYMPINDLLGIKEKYKGRLALVGGFQWVPSSDWPDTREETVRQMVRDCIVRYAPGGGYAFCGMVLAR